MNASYFFNKVLEFYLVSHAFSFMIKNCLKKCGMIFYSQLAEITVRKPAAWAGAIFYAYAEVNSTKHVLVKEIADQLEISSTIIYKNGKQVEQVLQLKSLTRYLSEEGFVISLFE